MDKLRYRFILGLWGWVMETGVGDRFTQVYWERRPIMRLLIKSWKDIWRALLRMASGKIWKG